MRIRDIILYVACVVGLTAYFIMSRMNIHDNRIYLILGTSVGILLTNIADIVESIYQRNIDKNRVDLENSDILKNVRITYKKDKSKVYRYESYEDLIELLYSIRTNTNKDVDKDSIVDMITIDGTVYGEYVGDKILDVLLDLEVKDKWIEEPLISIKRKDR